MGTDSTDYCRCVCEIGCERYWMIFPHYSDVIMGAMVSQITSLTIVCLTVYSGVDQRKHQSSASPAFVWGIHRSRMNSPRIWPVTWKMLPFDDVIMASCSRCVQPSLCPPFLSVWLSPWCCTRWLTVSVDIFSLALRYTLPPITRHNKCGPGHIPIH